MNHTISNVSSKTVWTWLSIIIVLTGIVGSWSVTKYKVTENSTRIQVNQKAIDSNRKQIQTLSNQMTQIQTSQDGMKTDIKDIKGNVKDINKKMDKMYDMFIQVYRDRGK